MFFVFLDLVFRFRWTERALDFGRDFRLRSRPRPFLDLREDLRPLIRRAGRACFLELLSLLVDLRRSFLDKTRLEITDFFDSVS